MSGSGRQRPGCRRCAYTASPQRSSNWLRRRLCISHPRCCPKAGREDVRVEIADGQFREARDATRQRAGDERVAVALPGMCNVHSHGFQRGMAGLTEFRGPAADNFWSWRTLMYRFVARMTPEDLEAITAQAYVEMLESGFTRVGEFHYVHHDPAGKPYANPAETAARVAAAAARTGIAPHAAAGVLRARRIRRRAAERRPAPLRHRRRRLRAACWRPAARIVRALPDGATVGVAPHSVCARSRRRSSRRSWRCAGRGPVHIHAAEQTGEVEQCVAWSGARPVQWLLDHAPVDSRWCLVHATHMTDDEVARLAAQRRGGGAVSGHRSQSRRRHLSRDRTISRRAARSASAPIRTCRSASPTSCASSNTASGCAIARATSSAPATHVRPDACCSRAPCAAARRRSVWRGAGIAAGARRGLRLA